MLVIRIYNCEELPPTAENANWEGDNSVGSFSCQSGYISPEEGEEWICTSDGRWEGPSLECKQGRFSLAVQWSISTNLLSLSFQFKCVNEGTPNIVFLLFLSKSSEEI